MTKKELTEYLESRKDLFWALSDKVWDNPETCFGEYASAEVLCEALEQEGFQVERGVAGIETAFRASFGSGGPVVGILGEYDALSGMSQAAGVCSFQPIKPGGNGHGCGHNILGAGALAGAFGLKKYLEETKTPGTVVYFGCPAEEGGSGKAFMARDGIFSDLDFALTWHPSDQNAVMSCSLLANYQINYRFKGVTSHAAASPHLGRSALDAVELMNIGVQFLREHVIQEARIHYAITNTGGYSPNVVQSDAEVLYLIRAPKTPQVEEIYQRVNKIAQGAALMTETELETEFVKACSNIVPNNVLERALYENAKQIPLPTYGGEELELINGIAATVKSPEAKIRQEITAMPEEKISKELREEILSKAQEPVHSFIMPYSPTETVMAGSSDVGDVSWCCPTSQFTASSWVAGTPAHSWQAVAVGKSPTAHKSLLWAGQVLACTAVDLLSQPEKIEAAKAELASRLSAGPYVCPIPADVKPRKLSSKT